MNIIQKNYYLFISIFFIFLSINIAKTKLLNTIIKFGGENLRYTQFSFNSNGDMIVDTSSFPVSNERRFYGLTKNGKFFFKDTNNQLTGFYSMNMDHTKGRIEGESYCIKLTSNNTKFHRKELILGISKILSILENIMQKYII